MNLPLKSFLRNRAFEIVPSKSFVWYHISELYLWDHTCGIVHSKTVPRKPYLANRSFVILPLKPYLLPKIETSLILYGVMLRLKSRSHPSRGKYVYQRYGCGVANNKDIDYVLALSSLCVCVCDRAFEQTRRHDHFVVESEGSRGQAPSRPTRTCFDALPPLMQDQHHARHSLASEYQDYFFLVESYPFLVSRIGIAILPYTSFLLTG